MKRYGFSGTNWTRKTTMIQSLRGQLGSVGTEVVSLSQLVAKCPYPMRRDQTLQASVWMVRQVENIISSGTRAEHHIFDRTPLDIMAFTRHAASHDQSIDPIPIFQSIVDLSTHFEVIFFCRRGGDWPHPVEPSVEDRDFAIRIDELLVSSISDMKTRLVELPWEASSRKALVLRTLGLANG